MRGTAWVSLGLRHPMVFAPSVMSDAQAQYRQTIHGDSQGEFLTAVSFKFLQLNIRIRPTFSGLPFAASVLYISLATWPGDRH